VPGIIGEIRRHLRDNNPILVSRSLRYTAYRGAPGPGPVGREGRKEPSLREVAEELGVPQDDVVWALEAIQEPVSLFEPTDHGGDDPIYLMDRVSDERDSDDSWFEGNGLLGGLPREQIAQEPEASGRCEEGGREGGRMLTAHKIALDPNDRQATGLARAAGTARYSCNWALEKWERQHEAHRQDRSLPPLSKATLRRRLGAIRRTEM